MTIVYDSGALIGAARGDRAVWADHRVRLEMGVVPVTTAPVVAQVSRSARQVQLRRFLRGCEVMPFGAEDAHDVGLLVGKAGSSDVVDAHVVHVAAALDAGVLTADVADLSELASHLAGDVRIIPL
ncbi:MAG: twitching motility protein PilT [Acidimicrobiia bacterium]